jgi:hypothetical protein
MRGVGIVALTVSGLWLASPGLAQPPDRVLSAEHKDIGKLETHIETSEQALAVISALRRSPGDNVECSGTCYFPSSRKALAWQCGPGQSCSLLCTMNPPASGCK